jgi:hypothetical protein
MNGKTIYEASKDTSTKEHNGRNYKKNGLKLGSSTAEPWDIRNKEGYKALMLQEERRKHIAYSQKEHNHSS